MIWGSKTWGSSGPFVDLKFTLDEPVATEAFDVGPEMLTTSWLHGRSPGRNDRDSG